MSRTKSQKARRLAQANHIRQVAAAQTREDIQRELIENRGLQRNDCFNKLVNFSTGDKRRFMRSESNMTLSRSTQGKRVTKNKTVFLKGGNVSDIVTLETKYKTSHHSRLDIKIGYAKKLLRLHSKYAKRIGMSKADMLDRFKRCYPSETFLLNL